jgi:hypothetical protein
MQKAQKGTLASAADFPDDEAITARLIADLRREIEQVVHSRIGPDRFEGPGQDHPRPVILLPSAAFWIEARLRVGAALANTAVLSAIAPTPLRRFRLLSQIRGKLQAILLQVRSGARAVERRCPEGTLQARGLAFANRLWRSARNRGWVHSPLVVQSAGQPVFPWALGIMELMSTLQRRDQIRERSAILGVEGAAPALPLESRSPKAA